MNRDVQKVAERHGQIVVERDSELRHFDEWLAQRNPRTVVCSVSGIGGIGKTTFLGQIADHACRAGVRTTHVDGYLGFSSAIELLSYLCEQHQCQPAGTDTGASTGAKRDEGFLSEVISLLSGRLGEHRTILLFDHFEEMLSIESFIRTQLIPGLPLDGVMLVFASRRGLSIGWRTDPTLITRTIRITLGNLSWHQSLDYVKRAGIENVDVQQQISRETSGYPLSLALAVQSVLSGNEDEEDAGYSINEISAGLIREVAPDLNPLLDGLMFLRTSTQNVLSRLLQKPVSSQEYRALGQLSFVRVTSKGLAIHDVARAYLLSDLKIRDPQRFDAIFHRAVRVLGDIIERSSGGVAYDATHNLITLCMYAKPVFAFPNVPVPMHISARTLPECKPVVESDVAELHHLVDTGVVGGMTMENPKDEHALLDMLLRHFPESLRVIRRSDGLPTAFTTLVPLHKEAIALLPRPIIEALRERLGTELSRYERISAEATDTLLSVITTVPLEPEEFTFFDLLLAIKLTGWSELAHGNRCLLFSSIPDVKTFHLQLGYEYLNPRGAHHQSVDVCALDFRNQSMGQWLVSLLLDATISPPSFHAQSSKHISTEMVRDALKSLRNTRLLMQSQLAKMLELSGDELYQELMALLTDIAPQAPLTAMLQNVLRLSYLNGMSIVAIAHELNVGRTTYYRYLDRALDALRQVLAVKQDEGLESLSDVGGLNHQNR